MKNLMRTLTLSAAALAALLAAPQSNADQVRRGGARETRTFRGETFRGGESRGQSFRPGRQFHGNEFHGRAFSRPAAFFSGRRSIAPFHVFAGSRFFSYCPGPGYIYIDGLGWVFPPFAGAFWVPAHADRFGVRIGGFWR
jgi:hypothetical protein